MKVHYKSQFVSEEEGAVAEVIYDNKRGYLDTVPAATWLGVQLCSGDIRPEGEYDHLLRFG